MDDASEDFSHVWKGDGGEAQWEPTLPNDEFVGKMFLTGAVGSPPAALCVETFWRGTTDVRHQVTIPRELFPLLRELLAVEIFREEPNR